MRDTLDPVSEGARDLSTCIAYAARANHPGDALFLSTVTEPGAQRPVCRRLGHVTATSGT